MLAASRLADVSDGTNSAYSYLAKPALADHTCPVRCELRPPGSVLPNRLTGRASSVSAAQSAGAAPFHEVFTTDLPDNTDNTVRVNGTNAGKGKGVKVVMAARLRAETTMTIGQIAQRLKMGTRDTLSAKLQERKGTNERAKLRTDMV